MLIIIANDRVYGCTCICASKKKICEINNCLRFRALFDIIFGAIVFKGFVK